MKRAWSVEGPSAEKREVGEHRDGPQQLGVQQPEAQHTSVWESSMYKFQSTPQALITAITVACAIFPL